MYKKVFFVNFLSVVLLAAIVSQPFSGAFSNIVSLQLRHQAMLETSISQPTTQPTSPIMFCCNMLGTFALLCDWAGLQGMNCLAKKYDQYKSIIKFLPAVQFIYIEVAVLPPKL